MTRNNPVEPAFSRRGRFASSIVAVRGSSGALKPLFARPQTMKLASISRKSRTDIKRLKSMKDSEIIIDKDAPAWTPEMSARAMVRKGLKPVRTKSLLSLRIDSDVLAWFRAQGRGYQSRMNALLRAFMEAHK
jgi:uncharacterized protein (DUF4415 family)